MQGNEEEEVYDVRVLAKRRYETYMQQKKAHEELEKLGLTSEKITARMGGTGGSSENRNDIFTELTMKITERFQKEMNIQDKHAQSAQKGNGRQLEQRISKEIENCTCPICYELMVPPLNSPLLIFPCGHTFCKECIIPKDKVKLSKCPFCRKPFQSYAVNLHLQNIICAYTDNKHLLEQNNLQEQQQIAQEQACHVQTNADDSIEQNLKLSSLRCAILEEEKVEIESNIKNAQKSLQVHQTVVKSLQDQRKTVEQKLQKLQQEQTLIDQFISENENIIQEASIKLNSEKEKLNLLEHTLIPLQKDRNKYTLLSQHQNH